MRNLKPFQGWRLTFFQGIIVAIFLLFSIRMYDLQVVQYDSFKEQADENRYSALPIASNRGVIYDRNNKLLAGNAPAYLVEITPAELPSDTPSRYAIYNKVSALVGVPPTLNSEVVNGKRVRSIERIVNEGENLRPFTPWAVAADVDREAALQLLEEKIELPGVSVRTVNVREYPTGELTAHVIGYMGPIGPAEAERLRELGYNPNFDRVGYDGIEAYMETELAGTRGSVLREVDVAGEVMKNISFTPPIAGESIQLTIDIDLQAAAQQALIDGIETANADELRRSGQILTESGVVIAMNPQTGEILAMVSYPSYDNSRFARAIDGDYYLQVLNDPLTPLVDHAIGSLYPPGSAWKLITATGVLQEDVISPTQTLFDPGDLIVANKFAPNEPAAAQRFVCWLRTGHGRVNITDAIAQSCNVYFYQVGGGNPDVSEYALRPGGLGIDNLIRYATMFGVGSETGVELPGEISGRMPDRNWKRIVYGENWSTGDTYNAAFGQGYISLTPLQLASYVQGIVSGTAYQPTLVREFLDEEGKAIKPFEPIISRTINLDNPNSDGTITLRLLEDMFIKGETSLACTCERDSGFYNPVRCNPATYQNTVDVDASPVEVDMRTYRVHVPDGYTFNGGVCNPRRFNAAYVPAFISEENLQIVRQGMRKTVTVGTAKKAELNIARYDGLPITVAGKTGTAEYCDNIAFPAGKCVQGAWPAHAWFTSYAPWDDPTNSPDINDKPEILVVAFVYNGKEGSSVALPIATNVLQAYYRIQQERQNPGGGDQLTLNLP